MYKFVNHKPCMQLFSKKNMNNKRMHKGLLRSSDLTKNECHIITLGCEGSRI